MFGIDKPLYTLDKIEENTNKIADMIKTEFAGRRIKGNYPLFNYIYPDLVNPY